MKVVIKNRNKDEWPFHSLENTDIPDCEWQLVANTESNDKSMIIVWGTDEETVTTDSDFTTLDGWFNILNRQQITKAEIIRAVYTQDEEYKILRDAAAGRNTEVFTAFDTFVESIPGN